MVNPPKRKRWSEETGVSECQDRPTGHTPWGILQTTIAELYLLRVWGVTQSKCLRTHTLWRDLSTEPRAPQYGWLSRHKRAGGQVWCILAISLLGGESLECAGLSQAKCQARSDHVSKRIVKEVHTQSQHSEASWGRRFPQVWGKHYILSSGWHVLWCKILSPEQKSILK